VLGCCVWKHQQVCCLITQTDRSNISSFPVPFFRSVCRQSTAVKPVRAVLCSDWSCMKVFQLQIMVDSVNTRRTIHEHVARVTCSPHGKAVPGKPYWRISTVHLLVLTNLDQLLFQVELNFPFFTKQLTFNEVKGSDPSPSVRLPWLNVHGYLATAISYVRKMLWH
jgi:hypothetical protein